jgi:YidC/Oxa1 family membrane protein insertase
MGFFEIFTGALAALYAVIPSYGVAIILLTLGVRILLLPLSIKQTRSMREMQMIQPEIKRLQKKYKGDRQKMNQELMALYKEHGVNPFGGCLPLLMQMPVFIALFYVIRTPLAYMGYHAPEDPGNGVATLASYIPNQVSGLLQTIQESSLAQDLHDHALRVNTFLGLRLDCSPSQVLSSGSDATTTGVGCGEGVLNALPYILLLLFMGATTYYQQRQMQASRGTGDPQQQQMQMIMKIMPLVLVVFGFGFPTGVVLYWVTTNVWTIVQQRIILKAAPPIVAPAKPAATKAKAAEGSKKKTTSGDKAKKDGAGKKPVQGGPGKPAKKSPAKKSPATTGGPSPHSSKKKKKR